MNDIKLIARTDI